MVRRSSVVSRLAVRSASGTIDWFWICRTWRSLAMRFSAIGSVWKPMSTVERSPARTAMSSRLNCSSLRT